MADSSSSRDVEKNGLIGGLVSLRFLFKRIPESLLEEFESWRFFMSYRREDKRAKSKIE